MQNYESKKGRNAEDSVYIITCDNDKHVCNPDDTEFQVQQIPRNVPVHLNVKLCYFAIVFMILF